MQRDTEETRQEKDYEHTSFSRYVVGDSIKNFTPSRFAVNMGTGAVSVLLHSFPYGSRPVVHAFGAAFLILNIVLFVAFLVIAIIRYVKHPKVFRLMYEHPLQSLYLGCFSMGFATIINAALDVYNAYGLGGRTYLYCLWGLWWFDVGLSLFIYFLILYTMITRHDHSIQALTAVWLLPTITAIVPSTTGALLATAIIPYSTYQAVVSLFMSGLLLSLGLGLTFMILPLYTLRLITEGLPPHSIITSKFIPVGPCGQAGTAFIVMGKAFAQLAQRGVSRNFLLKDPQPLLLLGVCAGLFLWMFGIWWILLSVAAIYETFKSNRPKFAAGFWGMVFPLGVYSVLTLQLADVLESTFFRISAAILSIVVFLLWTVLAFMTIYDLYKNRERLLNASCLSSSDPPSGQTEMYQQDRQLSSVETAC